MINARSALILLAIFLLNASLQAQPALSTGVSASGSGHSKFMPLNAVREGMRGKALTVFRGAEPEEFTVEILGVLPGAVGPKLDLIIGRIGGGGADRTAVFAGMSGSPVYIDGKLVGAISYSFPFSKEPICGITPIEQMVQIFDQKPGPARASTGRPVFSVNDLSGVSLNPDLLYGQPQPSGIASGMRPNSALMAVAGQTFQRIATPVTFNGFVQQTLDLFGPRLMEAGLLPVAAAGGSAKIGPLKKADAKTLVGGTSVMMQLTRGDISLAASGTVTFRDGDKVYAFGHPFLSLGSSDLPMSESEVLTVVPSVNNSFKLSVPGAMVGRMTQDRSTGVYGNLGEAPKMIPVSVKVRTSRGGLQTLDFEVVKDELLTPLLLNMTIYNTIISQERGLGDTMVELKGRVALSSGGAVDLERRFAGSNASQLAAVAVSSPVNALLRSKFDGLQISKIELELGSVDGSVVASLDRIAVDRTFAKPGETVEVQAFARTPDGRMFLQRVPVAIPEDVPAGPLKIVIGDGAAIQKDSPAQHFVPRDLDDLVRTINLMKRPDRLYAQLSRTSAGALIGTNELPNLPPSVIATLNNERAAGGVKPYVQTIVKESLVPASDFIILGQQSISIEVVR
ncbi:MAG: hypothetical protein AB7Q37_08805 [Pyrinomonadaceae bacterium]